MARHQRPLSSSSCSTAGASAPTRPTTPSRWRGRRCTTRCARYPHAQLIASGEAVGLPAGQMGNSEVGHMNMGAGRVVYQDLTRIDKSISDGELFESPALAAAMDRCDGRQHALHFIGLLSDGGVHSSQQHLHALIEMAARRGVTRVFVHVITDGRDTSPTGGVRTRAARGRHRQAAAPAGSRRSAAATTRWIATSAGSGSSSRYDAIVDGVAETDRRRRRCQAHSGRRTRPASPTSSSSPIVIVGRRRHSRSVRCATATRSMFFNFRADRARQLTRALALDDFDGFERPDRRRVHYTTMTVYDRTFNLPVVFTPQTFSGNLADVLAEHGAHEPAARRNGEVRARHLLLQLRPRGAVSGRGPDPGAVAEGRDLRPEAGDERPGNRRRARRATLTGRRARSDHLQLRQRRHGRPHRPTSTPTIAAVETIDALPRTHAGGAEGGRRRAPSSPPITATPSRCGTTS